MATLYRYFKDFWKLAVVALILAAINQVFSLLDPLIFRYIIDSYATRYREYSSPQFIRGVSLLLGAAVGVALVSRIAKNFQDYFVNVITQKVGARIYTDGVRHHIRRQGSLVDRARLFVDSSAAGEPEFSPEPQNQDRPKAHRDGDHR